MTGPETFKGFARRYSPTALRNRLNQIAREIDVAKHLAARSLIEQTRQRGILDNLQDAEFKVHSQWGDDGIIQYLIHNIAISEESRSFVEFGVEDYVEAETRFLLVNDDWRGLVMDADADNVASIRRDAISWRHELTAVQALVDAENVDRLLSDHGFAGEIGLLHIDIDGNDYWVWKALRAASPIVVVVEYNSVFGGRRAVTVPYDPAFNRTRAHYSNLYFGASLKSLCLLAAEKGYRFLGCSSSGNNAFFVRGDKVGRLRVTTAEEGYVRSRARESRDRAGNLTYLSGKDRLRLIGDLSVLDVESGRLVKLAELQE